MRPAALLSFLSCIISAQCLLPDVCYGSTGNQDTNLAVCDRTASQSSCCPWGTVCYSNGLCGTPGVTSVNSTQLTIFRVFGCTTQGGSADGCFPVSKCISKGVGVTACGANTYCCYGLLSRDCSNQTQVFTLDAGIILTTLPASAPTTVTSITISATTSPSTVAAVSTTATSTTPEVYISNGSNATAVGAGVGLGVGVALILIAALVFVLWRRRHKKQKALAAHNGGMTSPTPMYTMAHEKSGQPTVYSAVAQHNPDGPASSNAMQHASELDTNREPVQLGPSELKAARNIWQM